MILDGFLLIFLLVLVLIGEFGWDRRSNCSVSCFTGLRSLVPGMERR